MNWIILIDLLRFMIDWLIGFDYAKSLKKSDDDYKRLIEEKKYEKKEDYLRWINDSISDWWIGKIGQRNATTPFNALG